MHENLHHSTWHLHRIDVIGGFTCTIQYNTYIVYTRTIHMEYCVRSSGTWWRDKVIHNMLACRPSIRPTCGNVA